jgi:hypothetical protein
MSVYNIQVSVGHFSTYHRMWINLYSVNIWNIKFRTVIQEDLFSKLMAIYFYLKQNSCYYIFQNHHINTFWDWADCYTSKLYSGSAQFESWPERKLSWQSIFVVFLDPWLFISYLTFCHYVAYILAKVIK